MRYLLSGFFIFIFCSLYSQQYKFLSYTQEQGLAHSQVKSIFQDSHGYMWVGTLAGLSKFDGREFVNFTKIEGFFGVGVYDIIELKDHRILIGGKGGISFYNNGNFEGISFEGSFSKSIVKQLVEMDNGDIYILTGKGLITYRNGELIYKDFNVPFSVNMEKISPEEIVFVVRDCLVKYNGSEMDTLFNFEGDISDFQFINNNTFWMSTSSGLHKMKFHENSPPEIVESKLVEMSFDRVLIQKDGDLWGVSRDKSFLIKSDTIYSFTKENGFPPRRTDDIFEDNEGNIWFGTDGSGLLKFTSTNIATFTEKDGLSSELVMSFTEDVDQRIWVATYDGGINKIVNNQVLPFTFNQLLTGSKIWNNYSDSQGNIWFGMNNGLIKMKNDNFQLVDPSQLTSRRILTLYEDDKKTMWIGTRSGINYIQGDSISELKISENISLRTRAITQDKRKNYWFATLDGIIKYDGVSHKQYTEKDGLSENSVYDLAFDQNENIWIGTTSGLNLLVEDTILKVEVDNNPLSDRINFLHTQLPYLVVGTNNGVYLLNLDDFYFDFEVLGSTKMAKFLHLGIEDGLTSLEMNQNAVFTDSKKNVWVGSTLGASRINSLDAIYSRGTTQPQVIINTVKLDLQKVDWFNYSNDIDTYTGLPNKLELEYNQNHLTFEYAGLSFTYPQNIKYQYMLEGFDEKWQPITNQQSATYSNLDYNKYVFKVRSQNKSGVWSESTSFSFDITPPFWLTWWFLLLSGFVFFILTRYILIKRKKTLVSKYQSQLLQLEQQSLNSSMNRHFIFNSLNSIQYYINTQDRLSANKYLTSFAQLIRKNLDSSQTNHTSLADEIERLELYLELENMRFRDKFDYKIDIDPNIDQEEVRVPAMLLQPFLENSIWHGLLPQEHKGFLEVNINQNKEQVIIVITDNGIGIETSLKEKGKNPEKTHDSKGMNITKNRLDVLRKMTNSTMEIIGPYEVIDDSGVIKGTEVRITLTINYEKKY